MIQLHNVTRVYGSEGNQTHALRGVSLSIRKGEFVAIMGASGSGKSTMLHILGLLDEMSSGEYMLDGQLVSGLSEDERARLRNERIGFVFQAFNLLPRVSVLENVMMPLMYSSVPKCDWEDQAKRVIDQVGLSHRLGHEPSQLSGGEKQRVAIARALVTEPSVLFADEPTGNLDSASSTQVMDVFDHLHKTFGHTIILITHEDEIAAYADRVIVLRDGAIIDDRVTNR